MYGAPQPAFGCVANVIREEVQHALLTSSGGMDLRECEVTFLAEKAAMVCTDAGSRKPLRVCTDSVTLPPGTDAFAEVVSSAALCDGVAVVEGDVSLLLTQGECVARSLV